MTTNTNEVVLINSKTITLDEPLKRGDTAITQVTLRKPNAGELRGVSLVELANLNVAALQLILPRITTPILTKQDVSSLDPADLMELGAEVGAFFIKKADRMAYLKE